MRNSFVQWERRLRFGSERPELDTLGDSETRRPFLVGRCVVISSSRLLREGLASSHVARRFSIVMQRMQKVLASPCSLFSVSTKLL